MAVYTPLSAIERSQEVALASGVTLSEDGVLLTKDNAGGFKVASATAGEIVAGFAFLRTSAYPFTPASWTRVETFDVGVSNAVTLGRTPTGGTVFAWDNTNGAATTPASVVGAVVTLTAMSGNNVSITYRHALTVAEARTRVGDSIPGGYAGNTFGSCGLAKTGVIYTTAFDTSKNYHAGSALTAGANGLVTIGGTGTVLNAYVVSLPTDDYPYLGIEFNFA